MAQLAHYLVLSGVLFSIGTLGVFLRRNVITMLLSMLPIFVWTAVLKNPASPLSVGMSMFPPATPFLMLMRLALSPGIASRR